MQVGHGADVTHGSQRGSDGRSSRAPVPPLSMSPQNPPSPSEPLSALRWGVLGTNPVQAAQAAAPDLNYTLNLPRRDSGPWGHPPSVRGDRPRRGRRCHTGGRDRDDGRRQVALCENPRGDGGSVPGYFWRRTQRRLPAGAAPHSSAEGSSAGCPSPTCGNFSRGEAKCWAKTTKFLARRRASPRGNVPLGNGFLCEFLDALQQ